MDVNVGFIYKDFGYREYMWEVFSCIPLDLLPISIVLVYHRRNFQTTKIIETDENEDSV